MNRLIISAVGVILTFIWIIYTAPPQQGKPERFNNEPIKKINKSGSVSFQKIKQPDYKRIGSDSTKSKTLLVLNLTEEL